MAQLVARSLDMGEVTGSSPVGTTKFALENPLCSLINLLTALQH